MRSEPEAEAVIILAGGLGTRLRSVVPDVPKPMAPIAGRPFLEYQLDYWMSQGSRRFIVSAGYRHEAIASHFGSTYNGAALEYVVEQEPLGTGGGLLLAASRLTGDAPFVLLNGDTFFAVDLTALRAFAETHEADWCLSLCRTTEAGRYGRVDVSPEGRIEALHATTGASPLANAGVYFVQPRALRAPWRVPDAKLSLEAEILPSAIAAGQRVFGVEFSALFIDIGIPADFHRAQALFGATRQGRSASDDS